MEFFYKAKTPQGSLQEGKVEASSRKAAFEVLKSHNLLPVSLREKEQKSFLHKEIRFLSRVKGRELVVFSDSLASLVDAGVPLVEAIRVLAQQSKNAYFQDILFDVANSVEGGLGFSKSLAQYPKVFSVFYVQMIKIGEVSGNLQKTLTYLASYLEREYELKGRIKGAMMYPIVVLTLFFVVALVILVFVMPNLTKVISEMTSGNMPFLTKMMISLSHFVNEWIVAIIVGLVIIILALWRFFSSSSGKRTWDRWQLRLPVFGTLFKKVYQARFAENLGTLIQGGIPILDALEITGDVIGNSVYRDIIRQVSKKVKTGNSLASGLEGKEEFFPMLVEMISVGEKSGKLSIILRKVAAFYSQEVNYTVENLSALIEPILIIILGGAVGGLVASVILPIYSVITQVG